MVPVPQMIRFARSLTVGAVMVAVSACTGRVEELSKREQPATDEATAPTPGRTSVRGLGVSREEFARTFAPHLSRTGDGLESVRTRAGSRRMPLEGRFRSVQVAVKGPDGRTRVQCVTSKAELDQLLAKGAR